MGHLPARNLLLASLELSDTHAYEPQTRARLGTADIPLLPVGHLPARNRRPRGAARA